MLPHELEDFAVGGVEFDRMVLSLLTGILCRYAALLYSTNGHEMIEKVWRETMEEVGAFGVEKDLFTTRW